MNKGVPGRKYNISACTIRCFRKRIKEKFGREVCPTSESEMQASSHRKPKLPPVASGATRPGRGQSAVRAHPDRSPPVHRVQEVPQQGPRWLLPRCCPWDAIVMVDIGGVEKEVGPMSY